MFRRWKLSLLLWPVLGGCVPDTSALAGASEPSDSGQSDTFIDESGDELGDQTTENSETNSGSEGVDPNDSEGGETSDEPSPFGEIPISCTGDPISECVVAFEPNEDCEIACELEIDCGWVECRYPGSDGPGSCIELTQSEDALNCITNNLGSSDFRVQLAQYDAHSLGRFGSELELVVLKNKAAVQVRQLWEASPTAINSIVATSDLNQTDASNCFEQDDEGNRFVCFWEALSSAPCPNPDELSCQ